MLIIRQTQIEILERVQVAPLVARTVRRIQDLTQKMEIEDIDDIPVFVAASFEVARSCGLETEDDLVLFVECQAMFGSRFECDPTDTIEKAFSRPEVTTREKVYEVRGILCFEISGSWWKARQL